MKKFLLYNDGKRIKGKDWRSPVPIPGFRQTKTSKHRWQKNQRRRDA
jgi:hypothetical protein